MVLSAASAPFAEIVGVGLRWAGRHHRACCWYFMSAMTRAKSLGLKSIAAASATTKKLGTATLIRTEAALAPLSPSQLAILIKRAGAAVSSDLLVLRKHLTLE